MDSIPQHAINNDFIITENDNKKVIISFDSNMRYTKYRITFNKRSFLDSGTWKIINKSELYLISKKDTLIFNFARHCDYYYLFHKGQKKKFTNDISNQFSHKLELLKTQKFEMKTWNEIMHKNLQTKYYNKSIGQLKAGA